MARCIEVPAVCSKATLSIGAKPRARPCISCWRLIGSAKILSGDRTRNPDCPENHLIVDNHQSGRPSMGSTRQVNGRLESDSLTHAVSEGARLSDILNNKVSAQSLVDVLAERIEAAIVSGDLQPGSKLSEQALAAQLGVSRGPLREAIRRLEGRKLLQRTPNIGVRVAGLSPSDLFEVLQIREALEGMACALAAKNMSDE